jgi:sulfur-oxidizing protein SoxB
MSLSRRDFLQALAIASAGGMSLQSNFVNAQTAAQKFYDLPKFGNVHFLHFTDCHAQLLPVYFREPNVNLGIGTQEGKTPHLVGEYFLKANGIAPGTRDAYAFTYLDYVAAAQK